MTTSVILNVSNDHIWQCKCDEWHFRDERCSVCRQRYIGERRKILGADRRRQKIQTRRIADTLVCPGCHAKYKDGKNYCPSCCCDLVAAGPNDVETAIGHPSIRFEEHYAH